MQFTEKMKEIKTKKLKEKKKKMKQNYPGRAMYEETLDFKPVFSEMKHT